MSVQYFVLSASVLSILTSNLVSTGITKITNLYNQLTEHTENSTLKKYNHEIRNLDIHTKLEYVKIILEKYKDDTSEDIVFIINKLMDSMEAVRNKIFFINKKIIRHKSKYLHRYRTLDLSNDIEDLDSEINILNQRLKLLKITNPKI